MSIILTKENLNDTADHVSDYFAFLYKTKFAGRSGLDYETLQSLMPYDRHCLCCYTTEDGLLIGRDKAGNSALPDERSYVIVPFGAELEYSSAAWDIPSSNLFASFVSPLKSSIPFVFSWDGFRLEITLESITLSVLSPDKKRKTFSILLS